MNDSQELTNNQELIISTRKVLHKEKPAQEKTNQHRTNDISTLMTLIISDEL